MRARYLAPVAVLLALLALLAIGLRHDPREVPSPLVGKPAPALSLARLEQPDTLLRIEDLKGRPVLVNYFASWCAACVDEHPFLMQLASRGIEIIGVDYKDTPEDVRAWLGRHGNPYRAVISDPQGSAGLDWGVYGAPETFVLDAQGTIVYKQIGAMNESVWETRIAPYFGGKP